MSAVDTKFYEQKKSSTFYVAISFFVIVLLITVALFFYEKKLQDENAELLSNVSQLENSIESIEQDPNIQAYSIYEKHAVFLNTLGEQSNIPSFVSHLRKYFAINGIESTGFNYSAGSVSTELSAQTNDNGYAYQKVVKFLRDYTELGDEALFTAEFVPSVNGYDRINFTGQFKLK